MPKLCGGFEELVERSAVDEGIPMKTNTPLADALMSRIRDQLATKGSDSELGNFTLDQITEDFVQAKTAKFFERKTGKHSTPGHAH